MDYQVDDYEMIEITERVRVTESRWDPIKQFQKHEHKRRDLKLRYDIDRKCEWIQEQERIHEQEERSSSPGFDIHDITSDLLQRLRRDMIRLQSMKYDKKYM